MTTCGAGGGTPQHELLRLCERDVAAVRERRDAQAAAVADILIAIRDLRIADVHLQNEISLA